MAFDYLFEIKLNRKPFSTEFFCWKVIENARYFKLKNKNNKYFDGFVFFFKQQRVGVKFKSKFNQNFMEILFKMQIKLFD